MFEALKHSMNGSFFPSYPIYVKRKVGPILEIGATCKPVIVVDRGYG
jgi:hypothetical protein